MSVAPAEQADALSVLALELVPGTLVLCHAREFTLVNPYFPPLGLPTKLRSSNPITPHHMQNLWRREKVKKIPVSFIKEIQSAHFYLSSKWAFVVEPRERLFLATFGSIYEGVLSLLVRRGIVFARERTRLRCLLVYKLQK